MKQLPLIFTLLLVASPAWAGDSAGLQDRLYDQYGLEASGFIEARGGLRTQDNPYEKEESLAEARLQLDLSKDMDLAIIRLKGDIYGDAVVDEYAAELREFNVSFSPLDSMDVKVGRQILTWGTGDMLFINDMFPKDWQSFFIGRDDEYLKAPADAIKSSLFTELINIDLVWTPIFDPSNHISGQRLSYWNSGLNRIAGRDYIFGVTKRDTLWDDSEVSVRISRNIGSKEFAIYGYSGFWKEPEGMDPASGNLRYPRLSVYGASLRAPLAKGIANIEAGYYDSRQDRDGTDPATRNSESRLLVGYEQELSRNFTGGLQYYLELMDDYEAYKASQPAPWRDELRHMLTMRLTRLMMNQNLILTLFTYYSPSDHDGHTRLRATYKLDDHWLLETGANLFLGEEEHTFWGQFEENSNVFIACRLSF
ncbi:MAG: hypothetical protein ABFR97_09675 [Thermodesulfobacteriota bacterium]